MQQVTAIVRVANLLGAKAICVTHAVGALKAKFKVGDVVLCTGIISIPGLAGNHPLNGPNIEEFGTRFPPTSNMYSDRLKKIVLSKPKEWLKTGTFVMVGGPSYESVEESIALSYVADCVGMSSWPECVVAHHCGMEVVEIMSVTNVTIIDHEDHNIANHTEVVTNSLKYKHNMVEVIETLVSEFNKK